MHTPTFLSTLFLLALSHATPTPLHPRTDTLGGAISLGPTKSTITHAITTLIPGFPPTNQTGTLFLWPGMSNGTGDLVQTTLEQ